MITKYSVTLSILAYNINIESNSLILIPRVTRLTLTYLQDSNSKYIIKPDN